MLGELYLKRSVETEVLALCRLFPAVVIIGPRQVGKTSLTLAIRNQVDQASFYLDLERPEDLAAINNLESYSENNLDSLIILDEIQRKPALFPELRSVIDRHRRPGRFLLLGSASLDLIRDASESLAGRIAVVELTGLTFGEVKSVRTLTEHWDRGGFPDAVLAATDQDSARWRNFFLRTYFERDLRLLGIDVNPVLMRRLLTMLAHHSGQLISYESLGRSLSIDSKSLRRYLDRLEQTFLVRRLPPFFTNTKKRLVKSPKMYLRDTGILHTLLGIPDHNALLSHPIVGASWEGYVLEQLAAKLPEAHELFFYRTHAGAEVDIVVCRAGVPVSAVEVKLSTNPKVGRGFTTATADLGITRKFVVAPLTGPGFTMRSGVRVIGVEELELVF